MGSLSAAAQQARPAAGRVPDNPFPHRIAIPDFPAGMSWINTSGPLQLRDLRGKFVLLDFWTYCCINCLHVLPELKKLEQTYERQLVVIGVHSAKFATEREDENIRDAVLRHEIAHPVVNDARHILWKTFGVSSWPTVLLIDPEGKAVFMRPGEFKASEIAKLLEAALPHYRAKGVLDESRLRFELASTQSEPTPLRFPGKILADPIGQKLFIADSSHHRLVVTDLEGNLLQVIGRGVPGAENGPVDQATFRNPQGMALQGDQLYVADTDNHLIRLVDLKQGQVRTVAGTGVQGRNPWPGWNGRPVTGNRTRPWRGAPRRTALSSPWDLYLHEDYLYIAMAGPHQIWRMKLDQSTIEPYAGNAHEDIVDGPRLPSTPFGKDASSFAQPSGLAADDQWLYVADSEGSSIRAVPLDPQQEVRTVVGTAHLPMGRLFHFGDRDGGPQTALLQHPLGLARVGSTLYVADTYNNKIRAVDLPTGKVTTLVGTGETELSDDPATFDEPAGLTVADGKLYVADTNHHLIRVVDLQNNAQVRTLQIAGLEPPQPAEEIEQPEADYQDRLPRQRVTATAGRVPLEVHVQLPSGWQISPDAPMSYQIQVLENPDRVVALADPSKSIPLEQPAAQFSIDLPVTGQGSATIQLTLNVFRCQHGRLAVCKAERLQWTVPLRIIDQGGSEAVTLRQSITE